MVTPPTEPLMRALLDAANAFAWRPMAAELGPAQRVAPREISRRASQRVLAQLKGPDAGLDAQTVVEVISETLFQEQRRLAQPEDSRRAEVDRALYAEVAQALPHAGEDEALELARRLVEHYAGEIEGHFDPRAYLAATRVIPAALNLLLHGIAPSQLLRHLRHMDAPLLPSLDDRLIISGRVESLKRLTQIGTVMLVPTHQSHLDSPVVGYAIYRMGLPPFVYGAGLNLFTNPVLGFFLGRLGAYSVDRRKHNPLYLETLKAYATASMELGQHNLFFPGGTRSRSGAIEDRLKKGLLGSGIAAFGSNLRARKPRPRVFIVPCTCSYPLVLEGHSLIEDHLQREAGGRYIPIPDESDRLTTWLQLMESLIRLDLRVHVRIGQALDPFGNHVDDDGQSRDGRDRPLDPAGYMMRDGELVDDAVRDGEYTRYAAQQIVSAFHRDNTVLPTHALAYAVLEQLRERRPEDDWVRFLRGLRAHGWMPRDQAVAVVSRLRQELVQRAERDELRLDESVATGGPEDIVSQALEAFSSYHAHAALRSVGGSIHVEDQNLAFFYRNRLEGYGLLNAVPLSMGVRP